MPAPLLPSRQSGAARALVVAGMAVALVAGLFLHSRLNKDPAQELVQQEAQNVASLARQLWEHTPDRDFSGLTTQAAVEQRLVPSPMLRPTGPPVRSPWGTEVEVLPYQVAEPADAFVIRYKNLPPTPCRALILELAHGFYDTQAHRQSVMAGGQAVPADVSRACQGASTTVDFIYQPEYIPGTAMKRAR